MTMHLETRVSTHQVASLKYRSRFVSGKRASFRRKYCFGPPLTRVVSQNRIFVKVEDGGALKVETYRQECVAKRLIPFIDSKYKREDVLFWPDLASWVLGLTWHYARQTQELLEREGIPFVPKEQNPLVAPSCALLRTFGPS